MQKNRRMLAFGLGISVIFGGCSLGNDNTKSTETETAVSSGEEQKISINTKNFVRVQDYNGEGYALRNGEKTDKIAEDNREEIEVAVKKFFSEKFKTDVIVHNLVGAVNGVSVFVESVGEPHFHAIAIVPIDVKSKTVKTDGVWSQEGQVENALSGGLYAMAYEEEMNNLDNFVNQVITNYPVIGKNIEAVNNTASGHSTPHYYISIFDDVFDELNNLYLKNQNVSKEELRNTLDESKFNPDGVNVTLNFFMKEANTEPNEEAYDEIYNKIKTTDGLPRGSYALILNDNTINSKYGTNTNDNTINKNPLNQIMKE
ncbi:Protein of unknown function [Psychrobacillus sp. OK028]|uniref:DUF1672 family protein n=1 Tax=Psychrobacillus sp. OK028 TaxID=1884359 RepID=UPI00087FFA2C|nr:DUF1672 family protein [Psychrobacillus sp. OK028]SDN71975.1 Protein of unknown function [Psychrobacillus sp. OK028]